MKTRINVSVRYNNGFRSRNVFPSPTSVIFNVTAIHTALCVWG